MSKPRLILADDHPVYLDGLRQLLLKTDEFEVIHEATNGREALDQARQLQPDVLMLDVDMPDMGGLDVARECHRAQDAFALMFLTMHTHTQVFNEAMSLGVQGYVLKDSVADEIRKAVRTVARGQPYVSPALTPLLISRANPSYGREEKKTGLDTLTASERRILRLIASDRTTKEIAAELGLSPRTVENHRTNTCRKLGVTGSHALIKFAFENKDKL